MVEVFKTNVTDTERAKFLLEQIHDSFLDYEANFDLGDCDNILRVECKAGIIQESPLIALLQKHGYYAEVLPDEPPLMKIGMLPFLNRAF